MYQRTWNDWRNKTSPSYKRLGWDDFVVEFFQTFSEYVGPPQTVCSEGEGTLLTSLYEAPISLIAYQVKIHLDTKDSAGQSPFDVCKYWDLRIILSSWIQHKRKIFHQNQVNFFPGIQEWFNKCNTVYVDRPWDRKHSPTRVGGENYPRKASEEAQHSLIIKQK